MHRTSYGLVAKAICKEVLKWYVVAGRGLFLFISFLLAVIGQSSGVFASTLHGTVYDWSTFEPLDNTLVEVNSTPAQSLVAVNGEYSFELPPGSYQIVARHYSNGVLESVARENFTIESEGSFVLDLLLVPPELEEGGFEDIDVSEPIVLPEDEAHLWWAAVALAVLLASVLLWRLHRTRLSNRSTASVITGNAAVGGEDYAEKPLQKEMLPEDLQRVVDIISGNGGRITQKELRRRLNLSEAKVSLMVSDLEARNVVEKLKKGRGNILILKQR
jgi:uncharacterized membrane protein